MKVIGLVSGGKDSCYALMQAVKYGHQIVALANLKPSQDEMDSWMYQSVGHEAIEAYARAFAVPLFRASIDGTAEQQTLYYAPRSAEDEVESLFYLLSEIKVEAVSSGAILSDYQRNRVESVCARLGLVSLSYLWRREQQELLKEMIGAGVHAVLIKVAALGLNRRHLGKSITELQPMLEQLAGKYGLNPCGEGGEYESFTLDCPLFRERIVLDEMEVVEHSRDASYLKIKRFHLEPKTKTQPGAPPAIAYLPPRTKAAAAPAQVGPVVAPSPPPVHFVSTPSRVPNAPLGEQVRDIIEQLKARLSAAALRMEDVRFTWVYVKDMKEFPALNAEYARHFPSQPPCRATVQLPWAERDIGDVRLEFMAERIASRNVLHVQSISEWAAACIGPYAQAISDEGSVVLSGQIGLHPPTMQLVSAEPEAQCACALRNLAAVLAVMGSQPAFVMAISIFVTDKTYVSRVQPLVRAWLGAGKPTETYLVVPALPKGASVELQLTAAKAKPLITVGTVFISSGFEQAVTDPVPVTLSAAKSPTRRINRAALTTLTVTASAGELARVASCSITRSEALVSARLLYARAAPPSHEWCAALTKSLSAPISLVEVTALHTEEQAATVVLELTHSINVPAQPPQE